MKSDGITLDDTRTCLSGIFLVSVCKLLRQRYIDNQFVYVWCFFLTAQRYPFVNQCHFAHDDLIKWKHFPRYWLFVWENSPVTGEFPSQRTVTRGFDVFFDLRLNKRLSKQSRRRWFETPSRSLRRHCNDDFPFHISNSLTNSLWWVWNKRGMRVTWGS